MKTLITVFICLSIVYVGNCQHPIVIRGNPIVYKPHTGYIRLKAGKQITGVFEYADMEFPGFNIKSIDRATGRVLKRYQVKEIQEVVLAGHDSAFNNMDSTYFFNITGNTRLFRQLTFGKTKLYDNLFTVDENTARLGTEFLIEQDSVRQFIKEEIKLSRALEKLPIPIRVESNEPPEKIISEINRQGNK